MLLTVNIGNSNIRFGLAEGHEIKLSWTINTKPYKSEDEYFALFKNLYSNYELGSSSIKSIVIGSVVPALTQIVADALYQVHHIHPTIVSRDSPSSIKHQSNQLGTDLYANAVAAHELYDGYKLVVDFGTALTLIGISDHGEMLGVIIAPGVNTALHALIGDTAQLPDIELVKPKSVLGLDTISCMQSGIVYGYVSMIEGLIDRVNMELNQDCHVIATGGLGHIYAPLTEKIKVDDKMHTLKGLSILHRNLQT